MSVRTAAFMLVLPTLRERVLRLRQASVWEGEGRRGGKGKTSRWRGDKGKVEGGQNEEEERGGGGGGGERECGEDGRT